MTLELRPVSLREAQRFIAEQHRHNGKPVGWKFGVSVYQDDRLAGVAIASRPTARALDDGTTLEVIRCCTDGTKNACTKLYGAINRAAVALGYRRVITYTLASEDGASLRAAGYTQDATLPARGHGGGRARYQENLLGEQIRPTEAKHRWMKELVHGERT